MIGVSGCPGRPNCLLTTANLEAIVTAFNKFPLAMVTTPILPPVKEEKEAPNLLSIDLKGETKVPSLLIPPNLSNKAS